MDGILMKICKTVLPVLLAVTLLASCKKDHYDVTNVHGVDAEGELLLPLASGSYTMMEMMERFQIDSLLTFTESGGMSFVYSYDHPGALNGSKLLRFKDWEYEAHYMVENPFPNGLPEPIDTVLNMSQDVVFEADNIHVVSALMKEGHFEFGLSSNLGDLGQVVVTTPNIKDAQGNDFRFVYHQQTGQTGFDLAGLLYQTDEPNTLTLNYEVHVVFDEISVSQVEFDVHILASDLAIREMRGYVDEYSSRNRIDTTFTLFPDNLSCDLEINGAHLRVSERNTFELDACLVVDTAWVMGDGIAPYSIFDPIPVVVDLPSRNTFGEVYDCVLNGQLNAAGGHAYSSSLFKVNAEGMNTLVTVVDTSYIDVHVDVDIPFAFSVDEVRYLDTVNMRLSEIDMPDMIEKLTLELTFNSLIPLNLNGSFFMFDSENEIVTDTLLVDSRLIRASFDGTPSITTLDIDITEDRIENVMRSDRIIMLFMVDTDGRDVAINVNQKLDFSVKTRVKYKGVVEL